MADLFSNRINVALFHGNIQDNSMFSRNDAVVVGHYQYSCRKTRNNSGMPYGFIHASYLDVTVRNISEIFEKELLSTMTTNEADDYTFLFNADYDNNLRIKRYDDGFIVRAFPIDIVESFSGSKEGNEDDGQRIIKIKMLITSIIYLGESSLSLNITNA
ncbi:MAG: hypothetical protein J1E82_04595 [Muribaculaceae bacterium]|nr:hypothetical protein [Muribaculaceae bacterium]